MSKVTLKEYIIVYGIVALMAANIYFISITISYVLLFLILILYSFSTSKTNYFWITIFLIFYFAPLGLFGETHSNLSKRMPLLTIMSGVSFSPFDIFLIVSIIKALFSKKRFRLFIKKPLVLIMVYVVFLILIAILVRNTSFGIFIDKVRKSFYFSVLFSFPVLISNKNFWKIIDLLKPVAILIFIGAIYFLLSGGDYIYNSINPDYSFEINTLGLETSFKYRYTFQGKEENFTILFLLISASLIYYHQEKKNMSIWWFWFTIAFSTIIITGTRSWFVIAAFLLLALFYKLKGKEKLKALLISLIVVLLIAFGSFQHPNIGKGLQGAWERQKTIFSVGVTSSASTQRIEGKLKNRLPQQLIYISQSPLIGWGYTEVFSDGDVGNFALIVQVGIIGFMLFIYLWYYYFSSVVNFKSFLTGKNDRRGLNIVMIGFVGLLISHFTTNQVFGLYNRPLLVSIYIIFTEFLFRWIENNKINKNEYKAS